MDYIYVISATIGLLWIFMAVAAGEDFDPGWLFTTIFVIIIVVAIVIIINLLARDFNI